MRKLDLENPYQNLGRLYLSEIMIDLRIRRQQAGMTQKQLSEITGVSVSTISKYERGLFPTRVVWLAALADSLKFTLKVEDKD